jgi:hypothetical protein
VERLTNVFGQDWCQKTIIPKMEVLKVGVVTNRLVCANVMARLVNVFDKQGVEKVITPIAIDLTRDTVANVRFNGVKVLEGVIKKGCGESIKSIVKGLEGDADLDVQFFAKRAMVV